MPKHVSGTLCVDVAFLVLLIFNLVVYNPNEDNTVSTTNLWVWGVICTVLVICNFVSLVSVLLAKGVK